jgi:hypothetical protein
MAMVEVINDDEFGSGSDRLCHFKEGEITGCPRLSVTILSVYQSSCSCDLFVWETSI